MLFDTHSHVNFSAFEPDRAEVVKRTLAEGVWMNNVGTQASTSKQAVDLASQNPNGVFATIGLHPIHTYQQMVDEEESHFKSREESFDEKYYESLLNGKVVAVGECGLDYYRLPNSNQEAAINKQKEEFIKQLKFAKKHNLPVVIHCRDAYEDVLEILKSEYSGKAGIIHSFTDSWETAKKFLDIGFMVALNGILTFDKTGKLAEVAKNIPADNLLIETDAPYLTPPPHRGKRNEPGFVRHVAEKIADIREVDFNQIAEATFLNATRIFNIK